ncbi:MAG: hypothetical protein IKD72_04850 [Clostridia bacterium]|nr:hypothetical protein [Clostridia bacterium]
MELQFNKSAQQAFDVAAVDTIPPDDAYPVRKKTDPYGREYYGVSHFWHTDEQIDPARDLSWMEWDGNEINVTNEISGDAGCLFRKTVGILKGWQAQMEREFPDAQFALLASYDDGSDLIEESDPFFGFTLRFWKIRAGQGPEIDVDRFDQPVMMLRVPARLAEPVTEKDPLEDIIRRI